MTTKTKSCIALMSMAILAAGSMVIVSNIDEGFAIPTKKFTKKFVDNSYKLGDESWGTANTNQGYMKAYAKGDVPRGETKPAQMGTMLSHPVQLTAGKTTLIEMSGTVDCDWNNLSRYNETHCMLTGFIQEPNQRKGHFPSWCNWSSDDATERDVYKENNKRFQRGGYQAFNFVVECTPPTSGTYDIALYGHAVAGDGHRDFTSLKVNNALFNILSK